MKQPMTPYQKVFWTVLTLFFLTVAGAILKSNLNESSNLKLMKWQQLMQSGIARFEEGLLHQKKFRNLLGQAKENYSHALRLANSLHRIFFTPNQQVVLDGGILGCDPGASESIHQQEYMIARTILPMIYISYALGQKKEGERYLKALDQIREPLLKSKKRWVYHNLTSKLTMLSNTRHHLTSSPTLSTHLAKIRIDLLACRLKKEAKENKKGRTVTIEALSYLAQQYTQSTLAVLTKLAREGFQDYHINVEGAARETALVGAAGISYTFESRLLKAVLKTIQRLGSKTGAAKMLLWEIISAKRLPSWAEKLSQYHWAMSSSKHRVRYITGVASDVMSSYYHEAHLALQILQQIPLRYFTEKDVMRGFEILQEGHIDSRRLLALLEKIGTLGRNHFKKALTNKNLFRLRKRLNDIVDKWDRNSAQTFPPKKKQ